MPNKTLSGKKPSPGKWWDLNINFFYGCSPVSSGCKNCWASASAWDREKKEPLAQYQNLVSLVNDRPTWNGQLGQAGSKWRPLLENLKAGSIVTLQFMGDLCYPPGPDYLNQALQLPPAFPHLLFVVATKRPERFRVLKDQDIVFPNLIILASVEDQLNADSRLHHLNLLPTPNIGVCYEPAIGPVDLFRNWPVECLECGQTIKSHTGLKIVNDVPHHLTPSGLCGRVRTSLDHLPRWVIAGAETGPLARGFHYEWAERMLEFCLLHNYGKSPDQLIKFYYKFGKNDDLYWQKLPYLHGERWAQRPVVISEPSGWCKRICSPQPGRTNQVPVKQPTQN